MSDAFESFPDVESDIQGRSTLGEDQDASPVDPLVSKRLDCLERIQGSAFSGSASPARSGGDLEAVHQVERQHAERLPSAVGPVVGRGNGIFTSPRARVFKAPEVISNEIFLLT